MLVTADAFELMLESRDLLFLVPHYRLESGVDVGLRLARRDCQNESSRQGCGQGVLPVTPQRLNSSQTEEYGKRNWPKP
ncbi:MAG: hypothetical protein GX937_14765 [Lentisphaerae bacterium]|nr:hypothetical protein [Lentisphaerota bacterium]